MACAGTAVVRVNHACLWKRILSSNAERPIDGNSVSVKVLEGEGQSRDTERPWMWMPSLSNLPMYIHAHRTRQRHNLPVRSQIVAAACRESEAFASRVIAPPCIMENTPKLLALTRTSLLHRHMREIRFSNPFELMLLHAWSSFELGPKHTCRMLSITAPSSSS
jgi:hypothetical protein